ncbi:MAG: DUF2334 domain-containing protein [Kiritimatiellaeota bacterium]|nr:DUF2334 domain-containing protein [Kiritimatiellota bacterium]
MKFVFTCDDVGLAPGKQAVQWFEMVVEWLNGMAIPGTFFWVPKPPNGPSDENEFWMDAIRRARGDGHDFQLHGLTHHCLEFGPPQESIRRHAPKIFEAYDREPEKWEREHSVEALRKSFEEAATIYERAFGEPPLVFRAPCFGICENAYKAMFESGIRYSSSRSVNPAATGYVITGRQELEPWQPDYPGKPFRQGPGVLEMPCLEDLAIRGVESNAFDALLDLFKREVDNYVAGLGDWPCGVFGSHYHSMAKQMALTSRLYERLFDWMAGQGITEWTTFRAELE